MLQSHCLHWYGQCGPVMTGAVCNEQLRRLLVLVLLFFKQCD